MEPKKNPKYDVHRKRGVIFNFSLALSILVVIAAFQWAVPYQDGPPCCNDEPEQLHTDFYVPVNYRVKEDKPTPDKKPKPIVQQPTEFKPVLNKNIPVESPSVDAEPLSPPDFGDLVVENIPESDTSTFIIVEKMPEPVGGYKTFYKTLSDNLKYPRIAKRTETTGKVFVQFTVNEKGEVQNVSVLRGIGLGCDEEAMRVIQLTKWKAGKQRGRPVKVRMVQPIHFAIHK